MVTFKDYFLCSNLKASLSGTVSMTGAVNYIKGLVKDNTEWQIVFVPDEFEFAKSDNVLQ